MTIAFAAAGVAMLIATMAFAAGVRYGRSDRDKTRERSSARKAGIEFALRQSAKSW